MLTWPFKDPDEVLDYTVDWAARLEDGDTISSSAFTVPTGITKDSETHDGSSATVWLSGGTIGQTYEVLNRVNTVNGRTMDQSVKIKIKGK